MAERLVFEDFIVELSKTEHGDLQVTVLRPTKPGLLVAHEVRCIEPRMLSLVLKSC